VIGKTIEPKLQKLIQKIIQSFTNQNIEMITLLKQKSRCISDAAASFI